MRQGKFTAKERAYLMSLPAVETVTQGRIFYAEEFKVDCMRRYHAGDSPVMIFGEAGLYSSLIGYKRIERCIARWREDEKSGRLQLAQTDSIEIFAVTAHKSDLFVNVMTDMERDGDIDVLDSGCADCLRVQASSGGQRDLNVEHNRCDEVSDSGHGSECDYDDVHSVTQEQWWISEQTSAIDERDLSDLVLMRYESRLRLLEGRLGEIIERVADLEHEFHQR